MSIPVKQNKTVTCSHSGSLVLRNDYFLEAFPLQMCAKLSMFP